jgi:hypothetical protein
MKRVEVYRNLHNGKLSVRDGKTKHVIAHCDEVTLAGAVFKVSKAGRERVLRERKKNVHAVVRGKLIDYKGADAFKDRSIESYLYQWKDGIERKAFIGNERVMYNPYKFDSFVIVPLVDEGYQRIMTAGACRLRPNEIRIGAILQQQ